MKNVIFGQLELSFISWSQGCHPSMAKQTNKFLDAFKRMKLAFQVQLTLFIVPEMSSVSLLLKDLLKKMLKPAAQRIGID